MMARSRSTAMFPFDGYVRVLDRVIELAAIEQGINVIGDIGFPDSATLNQRGLLVFFPEQYKCRYLTKILA